MEKIDGAYDNVVGMPVAPTLRLIEKVLRIASEDLPDGEDDDEEDEEEDDV